MALTGDLAYEIERLREDHERLAAYTRSLEAELERRTDWTLGSIWNLDSALLQTVATAFIIYAISELEGDEWWHVPLGIAASFVTLYWISKRRNQLEKDDRRRIRIDSVIERF